MAIQVPVCVDYRLRCHCRIGECRRQPSHDWALGESSSRPLPPPNVSVTSPDAHFHHTHSTALLVHPTALGPVGTIDLRFACDSYPDTTTHSTNRQVSSRRGHATGRRRHQVLNYLPLPGFMRSAGCVHHDKSTSYSAPACRTSQYGP